MTGFAAHKLQEAVFAALAGDGALVSAVLGVYDEPPVNAVMPYVNLADTEIEPNDTKTATGSNIIFQVQVWSGENSQMQAKELMAQIDGILHASNLTITGHELRMMRLVRANCVRHNAQDGSYYQGTLRYKATTQKL
ncbi:MAG: DUF3168 domain-containing protein [Kordiimonadaceae bacterium]|nr:DUF3168 domain-containing protein [Kordiimonadaceae bacterium]